MRAPSTRLAQTYQDERDLLLLVQLVLQRSGARDALAGVEAALEDNERDETYLREMLRFKR